MRWRFVWPRCNASLVFSQQSAENAVHHACCCCCLTVVKFWLRALRETVTFILANAFNFIYYSKHQTHCPPQMSSPIAKIPKYNLPQALTAPFRSRSANPDGFDSKMKLWIVAIEDWTVSNRRLTFSLREIHRTFVSDSGVRPDKESIRLVLSEMKRRNLVANLSSLKTSKFWTSSDPLLESYGDPKSWVSWGVKKLVYDPASWALSTIAGGQNQSYSDLTDLSILDDMKFVSQKSLHELAHNLLAEFVRIAKAEEQFCFEWKHLLEIINPIMNSIIDATDYKNLSETLDILMEYLEHNRLIATQTDDETKLVKVANPEDSEKKTVIITQRDVATARLLRAKELLLASADRYLDQASRAKQAALECYNKKEVARAKSLLRSHKRFAEYAQQKEAQLTNVEDMLEQLENNDSNKIVLQAYKDGANALKIANDKLLDETLMLADETFALNKTIEDTLINDTLADESLLDDFFADELEKKLGNLVVCGEEPRVEPELSTEGTSNKTPGRKVAAICVE